MGATPIYGFPYPEGDDPADGPDAVRDLAEATEGTIAEKTSKLMIGGTAIGVTDASGNLTVPFTPAVTAVYAVVVCNGEATVYHAHAPWGINPTGFNTVTRDGASGNLWANGGVTINWVALVTP